MQIQTIKDAYFGSTWLWIFALVALFLTGCGVSSDDEMSAAGADYNAPYAGNNTYDGYEGEGEGEGEGAAQNNVNSSTNNGGTNVSLGGAQDFGYFRALLDQGQVPQSSDIDAAGFFAEHHTPLPAPDCGERVCLQAMLGVMGDLDTGEPCVMMQLGLNSPLTADPDNRPPLSLAVVVDVSGSMNSESKLIYVKQGLERLVNELEDDDMIAIISYQSTATLVFDMQPIHGNRNQLTDIARGLVAGGGTNLYEGLEMGYHEVFASYDSSRQNRLILLSDGEPTQGITNADQIISMSRAYNSDGVGLTTVGLGTDFNRDLMKRLAEQADGNHYFVENAQAVDEVFTEELSYFTVPVAFDLELELTSGAYFDFGRAVGSPMWEDTETGGRLDVPSVFLAHRVSHQQGSDEGRRGGGSALLIQLVPHEDDGSGLTNAEVAEVQVRFRVPGTGEIIEDTVMVDYPHAPWFMRPDGYFENSIVEKSFVMLNIFNALQTSCDLFHNGERAAAIGTLRRLIAAAEDYEDSANAGQGDEDIAFDVALMEHLIEVMMTNGASEPDDPRIPEDPWPAD